MSDASGYILAEDTLQTADVAASSMEAYWRDEVLTKFGPINLIKPDGYQLDCRIQFKFLSNELLIANKFNESYQLSRTQKHINADGQGFFVVSSVLKGGIDVRQKDSVFSLRGQGLTFYYSHTPFDIVYNHLQDTAIKIPEHILLGLLPQAKDIPAQFFAPQNPYFLLLSQLVQTLYRLPTNTSYLQGIHLRESFLQTLVAAISQNIGVLPERNKLDDYHYQKTLLFLKQHYTDETLDTEAIAQAVNLSTGHLQKIFSKMGTSIMQTLWHIRLEKASQLLSSQHLQCLMISEIAFRCGFKSSAHFSRAFRKHTDMSPREWLARHAGK